MLDKIKNYLTWPVAAVLIAGGVLFTAILFWAPPDVRSWLFGANGLLWTLISLRVRLPESGTSARRAPSVPPSSGSFLVLLALGVAASLPNVGCGATWVDQARHTIEVSAVSVNAADRVVADEMHRRCDAVVAGLEGAARVDAANACLTQHHLDRAVQAIAQTDRAMRVAQASLDAAEQAKDKHAWLAAIPCMGAALRDLLAALDVAGVHLPDAMMPGLLFGFAEAAASNCRPPSATVTP